MSLEDLLAADTGTIPDLIRARAAAHPDRIAIVCGDRQVSYAEFDRLMDRAGASLQKMALAPGDVVAICAMRLSIEFVIAFFGAARVGLAPAPLPAAAALPDLVAMIGDSRARLLIADDVSERSLSEIAGIRLPLLSLEKSAFSGWIAPPGTHPAPAPLAPDTLFNIIYSSGSTGAPKGIMHSHRLRWLNAKFGRQFGFDQESVTIISTPPYANLTIGHMLYCLFGGGTFVLMPKFDARGFLELAVKTGATHSFMVGLQYQRILDTPDFDAFDLSRFKAIVFGGSVATPEFKAELLRRWPGEVIEMYAMTEGGGRTLLFARQHPDKLHTVGRPVEGFDIRIVRDDGSEAAPGEVGELVGRSEIMMGGYYNQPDKTQEVEWRDEAGRRYIRMGDLAVLDEDGFLILKDRKKDMIISGGANVYPSDIERVLQGHPAVRAAAVVGAPSKAWGETPVAFVELRVGAQEKGEDVRSWANQRLGKIQRITALEVLEELPRTGPDKIAKPQLRQRALELLRASAGSAH